MNLNNWLGRIKISWTDVLKNPIKFSSEYQVVPTEGYLAWEYNPLRNYRLSLNMYEKDGKYYTEDEFFNLYPDYKDEGGNIKEDAKELPAGWSLRESGELVDFITNELSFSLEHPVDILPQYSYDGSVNLIINDGLNIPRLVNSRFTVLGNNTYKITDRKGDNDTNIYDLGAQFDIDTSLFKNVNKIPKLKYLGTAGGNLKIGNYHFYFKYADADGNETDWVAESGLVSVFMGNTPTSVNTGIRDENSTKSVRFALSNIDVGYSYVKVYYTRYSADIDSNLVIEAKQIDKNFLINNLGTCAILITGDENEIEVTLEDINSTFDSVQNAKTQCSCSNRLFMANVHKTRVEYDKLSKLSLCLCPYKHEEAYPLSDNGIDLEYNIQAKSDGYYNTEYIYNKTGYWPGDLYRLGVVYILKDGSLSPVFNLRGATNIPTATDINKVRGYYYSIELEFNKIENTENISQEDKVELIKETIDSILYSESNYTITGGVANNENAKGVILLSAEAYLVTEPFPIVGVDIRANPVVLEELKKYIKGFFFVRQKRIPLTLCLGIVVGLDKESRTPTLPTVGGVILNANVTNSFVETSNIYGINYISEGFLGRYYFKFDKKKVSFWKKFLTALAVVTVLAVAVVATVFTCGAAGAAMVATGASIATAVAAGGAAVAGSIGTIGIVAGSAIAAAAVAGGINAIVVVAQLHYNAAAVKAIDGRHDPIPEGYNRNESDSSRILTLDLSERYIIKDSSKNSSEAIIVPDYQVNLPYYNLFLTGDNFTVKLTYEQPITNYLNEGYFNSSERHFYVLLYQRLNDNRSYQVKLVGVPDGCPIKMIGESKYCARAGYPEEAYKYEFLGESFTDSVNMRDNSDIIRGNFGSYVGMLGYRGHAIDQVDIMIPGYKENELFNYVQIRAYDTSAFYAVSDRLDINEYGESESILQQADVKQLEFSQILFRGDCYICQYTHRIIRNFNDPSAPYNDKIVNSKSWKNNYNPDKPEQYANINLGDVNAVLIGLWLTFQLRSPYNLNIRTVDKSNTDEYLMCGNYRSFYPYYGQLADGNLKIPDSDLYNKGFSKSVSEKYYFELPDVPYIKLEFLNRIVFSDIHINDAYKNGFRVLRTMNHKDYPMTYGSITKLIEMKNSLLVVFEHGIGLIQVNNSAQHNSLILSDLTVISDTYGSQWKDSITKTPSGVYGVDTVARKIWRVRNGKIELISDNRVQEFLNQNISLTERELTPIIGVRNVKTLYNAYKHDVMFTFYDNLYGMSEKSWNLCWNEILQTFTTFYSWIPSEMPNIDNLPFSFNRDTVKAISKLGIGNHGNDFSDGITLSNNVLNVSEIGFSVKDKSIHKTYFDDKGVINEYRFDVESIQEITNDSNFIGFLYLDNRTLPEGKVHYQVDYELLRDRQKNHELFEIINKDVLVSKVNTLAKSLVSSVRISYLRLKNNIPVSELLSELYYRNKAGNTYADIDSNKLLPIRKYKDAGTNKKITIKDEATGSDKQVRIINKHVLDSLRDLYGLYWPVGVNPVLISPTALYVGTIGDIYDSVDSFEQTEKDDVDTITKFGDYDLHTLFLIEAEEDGIIPCLNKPIFKDLSGKRVPLPEADLLNPDKLIRYLNIRAKISIIPNGAALSAKEAYYNQFTELGNFIDAGYFESLVAITTDHNISLLSSDFWKHGLAGIIDITDKIFPTYWYGKQHPFEFECVVVDNPTVHKIFTNLELVSNKVKPESFHYEVIGDTYDFSDDKPTMYFRLEALKALYQYNGYDIEYNPNFLEIQPIQHNKSADLPKYYSRWDSINEIYDSYKRFSAPLGFNYDHLAGAEIVYYPTRNEFRVWNHVEAIDIDSLSLDLATSVIKANCRYLEDKWLVTINPIVVTYKNEFDKDSAQEDNKSIFSKNNKDEYLYSTWVPADNQGSFAGALLPPINIQGTKLNEKFGTAIEFPKNEEDKDNALYHLYDLKAWDLGDWKPIDPTKNGERRETDVRGKFIKIRIRYSGDELAIIDLLNTIYQISYA